MAISSGATSPKAMTPATFTKPKTPAPIFAYLGTDPVAYQAWCSKQSNEDVNDWTDLIELARVFDQTAIADLPAKLDKLIDVDSFLAALASTTRPSTSTAGRNGAELLPVPASLRPEMGVIVWDPSLAFGALPQGLTVQQMKDLALEWVQSTNTGAPGGGGIGGASVTRPIATKLWQVPAYKQRYREIYRSIVEKQMVTATLIARMNVLRDLIRPFVEKDTQKLVTQAQFDAAMTSDATSAPDAGPGGAGGFKEVERPAFSPSSKAASRRSRHCSMAKTRC